MCNIFDYYYDISGAPKKDSKKVTNNQKKSFKSASRNKPVFETLDDVANYRMHTKKDYKDFKILQYYRYGVGLSARMHVFICNIPTASDYPGSDWIPYTALRTHLLAPKNITNPWSNTHNTIRINYLGFYRLHSDFISRNSNLYSSIVGRFQKKKNSNKTVSWFDITRQDRAEMVDAVLRHFMHHISLMTHGNVSLIGKDSVNILENFTLPRRY